MSLDPCASLFRSAEAAGKEGAAGDKLPTVAPKRHYRGDVAVPFGREFGPASINLMCGVSPE